VRSAKKSHLNRLAEKKELYQKNLEETPLVEQKLEEINVTTTAINLHTTSCSKRYERSAG